LAPPRLTSKVKGIKSDITFDNTYHHLFEYDLLSTFSLNLSRIKDREMSYGFSLGLIKAHALIMQAIDCLFQLLESVSNLMSRWH
jgi:hypothetical protein